MIARTVISAQRLESGNTEKTVMIYEELRSQVLTSIDHPYSELGLALLMRDGMAAWAEACLLVPYSEVRDIPEKRNDGMVHPDVRAQLVNLLVEMTLGGDQQRLSA